MKIIRTILRLSFFLTILCLSECKNPSESINKLFTPDQVWKDTSGNPINAHGGGILFHNGVYYWFGEIKKGETRLVPDQGWECYRVEAAGISCYSSVNLHEWKYEGIALKPVTNDSTHDLHPSKVMERPKVIYNDLTRKFVMWLHVDSENYSYARAGVAVSDQPQGPYQFLGSVRPNGQMSRDQTIFKDDDGKAYHIFSSENNATMIISQLSADYLKPTGIQKRIFIDKHREAPAMFKRKGKYYLITSGCTGWEPNQADVAVSDSIFGNWDSHWNPCKGKNGEKTFLAQSTFVLPVPTHEDAFIFMADRWNKTNLEDSRYLWLPVSFNRDSVFIEWNDQWNIKSTFHPKS